MAHHHHHHLEPLIISDAQAVVLEAEALERETRRETAALVLYEEGYRIDPGIAEDQLQYIELRRAAERIVAISLTMQIPDREDPYAPLGQKINAKAKNLLTEIENGNLLGKPAGDDPSPGKA